MTTDIFTEPLPHPHRLLSVCLAVLLAACGAGAEDAAARAERIAGLVESLNAGYQRREEVKGVIYNEIRGENAEEMHEALKNGFLGGNLLVQLGSAETLAMHGSLKDLDDFGLIMDIGRRFEVKVALIRLLPAFLLWNNERARLAYIRHVNEGREGRDASVFAPLRKPPLTRRGRLDAAQDKLRGTLAGMLLRQLDPVASALPYINDVRWSEAARGTIQHHLGNALGNDPRLWRSIWDTISRKAPIISGGEVEEIRLAVLDTLADMGAEGLPETLDGIRYVLSLREDLLDQAVLEALAVLCRVAYDEARLTADPDYGLFDGTAERTWLARRYASAGRLGIFAAETALDMAGSDNASLALSAVQCMGAAGSFPDSLPDTDGSLGAVRTRLVANLAAIAIFPGTSQAKRLATLRALGEVGTGSAVDVIDEILASPLAAPDAGVAGQEVAEAAVAALCAVASGGGDGRMAARTLVLGLLGDGRAFPVPKAGVPPVQLNYIVMWRLQRLARMGEMSLDPEFWRGRLGW